MKLFKWSDVVFTVAIIGIAMVLWACFQSAPTGAQAVIRLAGEKIAVLPLDRDAEYTVRGEFTNIVQIKAGEAFVAETDCPNKLCQKQGGIQKKGQSIVCVPNQMTVTIEGGEDSGVDAITQ